MRHVLVLDVQDDAQAVSDYRHWHRPGGPPEAVTRSLRDSGIVAMEIWHVGDRLVMVMDTDDTFDPSAKAERDATDPDIQAWERLMDGFQRRLPFAPEDIKWVAAERIYDLSEQPRG